MKTSVNNRLFEIKGDYFHELNPPFNFASLEPEHSNFPNSWAVIVPVPYDATTTYGPGTRNGPASLLQASGQLELFDEELEYEVYTKGICTISPLEPEVNSPREMVEKVGAVVSRITDEGKFPVVVGGEHLVAVGAIRALARRQDFKVIHLDAHADLRESYQGSRYSNACVMRLVSEDCEFISVGIRSMSREEHQYMEANSLRYFHAIDIITRREQVIRELSDLAGGKIYISIDLDVLDPSVMPSVGTPEPGGIGWYDLLSVLKELCRGAEILGFDVVELSPQPGNVAPDFLAAKLIYKLLSYAGYYLDK